MRLNLSLFLLLFFLSLSVYGQHKPLVLITYYSPSGNTKKLAEAIGEGARSVVGVEVVLVPIGEVNMQDLMAANAILIGSPVYNANIAPAVQEFINSLPFEGRPLKDKLRAAFVTGGGISIGEEGVMLDILRAMLIQGMVVMGGEEAEAAFGASAITGEGPFVGGKMDQIFWNKGFGLGKRVAEKALRWK
ncbi:MAG: NAD(P)H-dependent oxidoreductase [Bacteroidetes bacterium]|nr:NAD(P)H-dependent oxidoreductase [Bacteroidota bacterium]